MPLIEVTYDESLNEGALRRLARELPSVVAEAVDCPEEPWIGPPGPGDIEIGFRQRGPLDVGDLNVWSRCARTSTRAELEKASDGPTSFGRDCRTFASGVPASG
jgi:hypothetical protein